MNEIHETAIISSKAQLGNNIKVGPFSIIHDDVIIDEGTTIGSHAVIYDGARIGKNVQIFQGASVSNTPQDYGYKGERTFFSIGDNTIIREFVSLHKATKEGGTSSVGKNCMLMAYCHVGHDSVLGDNVILANDVHIGGHTVIENFAIVGGGTPIHQFSRIGQHSMTGGGLVITCDVPPYVLAGRAPLRYAGMNSIGLRRRGFTPEDIAVIKKTYDILYNSGLNFSQAKERIKDELSDKPKAMIIYDFLGKTKRTILRK
ncbi:MAG: acyl-ACP--UDP-N-acetylglucosamine O-acyltransferase [Bacteroidetes bacterium]|nr:acyl-ACP--UDP-N-acetylglucosamine O-acyltransferase [Bacteroidota bacterium]